MYTVLLCDCIHTIHCKIFIGGQPGVEPGTSRTLNENHAARPLAHVCSTVLSKLPWLSRQSIRLLTEGSPVRARVGARARIAVSVTTLAK